MKIKLLMLTLSLSATGIATAMVGSHADQFVATDADAIAFVLTPDGYAHAASFSQLSQADASSGMPTWSLTQASLSRADPNAVFRSQMAVDRFMLTESDTLPGFLARAHSRNSASSQAAVHSGAVMATSDITQVGYYDAAYQLSPHVPQPQTWAMLLAALGLIGLQLRRANHAGMAIS